MDDKISEHKLQVHHVDHHESGQRKKFFFWITNSSEIIATFIAVAIIVTGSIVVFGNNAKKETRREVAKKTQQQKREKLTAKNVSTQLSANAKKITKKVAKANSSLKNATNSSRNKDAALGAAVGGAITQENLNLQANRRIQELWQEQNAVYSNTDLSEGLRNQIALKLTGKIGRINSIQKRAPRDASQQQLSDAFKQLQDQQVYNCYLPNVASQSVNEGFSTLAREQADVTKDLRGVSSELRKQGKKTDRLNDLISERNRQVRQITTNIQSVRQAGIAAENSNCATSPLASTPVPKQFTDLATLDTQIRQLVNDMLAEKGITSNPRTPTVTDAKTAKKIARQTKRAAKEKGEKTKMPTETPENAETLPTEGDTPGPTEVVSAPDEDTPEDKPTEAPKDTSPLTKPDFASLGLPQPQPDAVADLKANIEGNEKAIWAVDALLAGEKAAIEKGMEVIPYLTTAWIWFENGPEAWPDPYEINCNDNRTGYVSEVSVICQSSNYQIAGYQAAAQSGQYVSLFTKFYGPDKLADVIKRVASDSQNAIRPQWDYNDAGQQKGINKQYISQLASVKMGDISPNVDFFSEKGQYFTLLAGKDPTMVIALNSFAVSKDDLVSALKSGSCAYGYICEGEKQRLSNMVAALYELDGGTL